MSLCRVSFKPSVVPFTVMPNVIKLSVFSAMCRILIVMMTVVMLSVIMLSVIYAKCRVFYICAKCRYAVCCIFTVPCYYCSAECHYTKCRQAECRGAIQHMCSVDEITLKFKI